jgi:hypothetical protein
MTPKNYRALETRKNLFERRWYSIDLSGPNNKQ